MEQNTKVALQVAHYGYVLETGRIVAEGEAASLARDEAVVKAYLGA